MKKKNLEGWICPNCGYEFSKDTLLSYAKTLRRLHLMNICSWEAVGLGEELDVDILEEFLHSLEGMSDEEIKALILRRRVEGGKNTT